MMKTWCQNGDGQKFFDHMKDVSEQYRDAEIAKRWLSMSKTISKNPLGEWVRQLHLISELAELRIMRI